MIDRLAAKFGAREGTTDMRLSPSGNRIVYQTPLGTAGVAVRVADIEGSNSAVILSSNQPDVIPGGCSFKTDERLICNVTFISMSAGTRLTFGRAFSVSADGKSRIELGERVTDRTVSVDQSGASLVDWLPDDPDHILMQVNVAEKSDIGSIVQSGRSGVSVQKVELATGRMTMVESPARGVTGWDTDDRGQVRYKVLRSTNAAGYMSSKSEHYVRVRDGKDWRQIAVTDDDAGTDFAFRGFDSDRDAYLALRPKDGRMALYREPAAGGAGEMLYAHPRVDVDGLLRIGKWRRPVAVTYTDDARQYAFFDPVLEKRTRALSAALPGKPPVIVFDENGDGTKNLILAGGQSDPGRYYLYDTKARQLAALLPVRPELDGVLLGQQSAITYKARDGAAVPAYLTLPPGRTDMKGLPAIVMPHGGPWARDALGFDWLSQYFAALGYAVIQPNFRGSTGYGDSWYLDNGFKSWATAIGDVNDAGRWLLGQGADPARLAIVGWSYGGYAALQANVVEQGLYKAAVAIAPLTDFAMWKQQFLNFTNYKQVAAAVGDGPHIQAGSPTRHADKINVPVLMFHGSIDLNVDIAQARAMDAALAKAGKRHQLVVYPGLEHQLNDSAARTDMLTKSARWLAEAMPAK
ncbi:S9 family peptidase [Sandarakinorhabdus sp.]|uniref:alpha/beta hydrolase family protein n=1 Tax=Sandarakinorhabdus sp. TaxID=1916663 RepID=UPI00286DA2DA|nr:S9 family peptidase [Sandarakinorhabdus sp.]